MVEPTIAELAAQHALEYLIERCAEELYESYLDSKVIPFSLELLFGMLCGGIELALIRYDDGEPQSWTPDLDLVSNPIDSWARTHISVRTVVRTTTNLAAASPLSIEAKSVHSLSQQSLSQRSVVRRTTGSLVSNLKAIEKPKPYILESALEQPEPELDILRANKEREIQQRKADLEKERQQRQQREEEARRLERMASELRKSNFTYDYEGKIVVTKTRSLPSPSYVQYELASLAAQAALTKMKTTVSPKKTSASQAKRPVQVAKKAPVSELQFVKLMNSTPNIMELLKVGTGVTAFESNRAKRGPDMKSKTMTREEYKALTVAAEEEHEEAVRNIEKSRKKGGQKIKGGPLKKLLSEIPDSDREEEPMASSSLPALVPNENLSAIDKFNLQILKATDWGMNTGKGSPVPGTPLPAKPNAREERATHGVRNRKPRDRPFVERKTVRERLPQPPLGKTMGHGLLEQ